MTVGLAGYDHLFLFGVFAPYLAFKSARRLTSRPLPPKPHYFRSVIVILAVALIISTFVARRERIVVYPRTLPSAGMLALGAAVLVALVTLMRPLWRKTVAARSRTAWLFMPRTPSERSLWVLC